MNAIRLLFAAMVAALFTACASSYTDTGYRQSVYVDYEAIRAHGIEVTNGEVPNGRTAIGKLMEVRQFPRTYTRVNVPSKNSDDAYSHDTKSKYLVRGNLDNDARILPDIIADEVRAHSGRGIAELSVVVVGENSQPTFHISGIVYR